MALNHNREEFMHSIVYREPGKFGGWPANYGMWAWGDELVVGFTRCTHRYSPDSHARDKALPAIPYQARSLDGGLTWQAGPNPAPSPGGRGFSADEHMLPDLQVALALQLRLEPLPTPCPGGLDFTHPDFALMCARTGLGAGTSAWFYTSTDRAHSWQGPYSMPMFGQAGIEARTDYIVNGPNDCLLFLAASRENGEEGKGVFMARTTNGGRSLHFEAWVAGGEDHYTIMPASLRAGPQHLLSAVRCRSTVAARKDEPGWIDLYESRDDGLSWQFLNRPVPDAGAGGNPPAMLKLHDGRIVLVYGCRAAPYGIRARLSSDDGHTWGEVIHLRDDGGCADLGYPRTIQRPDGTLVTVYYFNDTPESERYIAATLWRV
jgi:hypothetical protein